MASVIEQAKMIPASTIAEKHGIVLEKHGARYWACCPFHTEKRPSMCFYPNGSWYCFSCNAGGDSISLLAQLKNLPMYDAAKEISEAYHVAPAGYVIRNAYTWKSKRVKGLKEIIRQADEYTGQYTAETAEKAWDDPVFMAAIQAKAQASCEIDELYAADQQELEQLMARGCSA